MRGRGEEIEGGSLEVAWRGRGKRGKRRGKGGRVRGDRGEGNLEMSVRGEIGKREDGSVEAAEIGEGRVKEGIGEEGKT